MKLMKQTTLIALIGVILGVALVLALALGNGAKALSTGDAVFTFSSSGITVSGSSTNYEIDGTDLKITAAGTYVLTGTCANGSVTVKKEVTGVTLILDGLNLTSSDTAPITCNTSTGVTIQVVGSNTLTDAESIAQEDTNADFEGAAIKVKSNATMNLTGSGTLNVNGNCKNAIKGAAGASITVSELTLNVTAENNALASDGTLTINSGICNLTAGNDTIKAEPDEGDTTSAGSVTINGGTLTLVSAGDGIQANNIIINGGTLNITAGGGYQAAVGTESTKGIKAAVSVLITGGTLSLNCADDAIHSNGDVTLTGGTYEIYTGDDGVHADYNLTLGTENSTTGPKLTIAASYEGVEGATILVYSGTGNITSSDDGFNAANGDLNGSYSFCLSFYGGTWSINAGGDGIDSNGDIYLYGGVIEVFGSATSADAALDYDGSCYYEGGTLLAVGMSGMAQAPSSGVSVTFGTGGTMGGGDRGQMGGMEGQTTTAADGSTTTQGNGGGGGRGQMGGNAGAAEDQTATGEPPARDTTDTGMTPPDGTAMEQMTPPDGTTGTAGIMETTGTTQSALSVTITAGSEIIIKDSAGNTVYTATGVKNANCVVFASETLVSGETYTLYVGGAESATATAAEGTGNGGMGGLGGQPTGQTQTTRTGTFQDVTSEKWYYQAVEYVSLRGIMNGISSQSFAPDTGLTRAMLVQMLYNMETAPQAGSASFTDVKSDAWYAAAVSWAASNGIVDGYEDGSFAPEDVVTREQAALILYRYAAYMGYSTSDKNDLTGYQDTAAVSSYALEALRWANAAGIVNGTDSGALLPQGSTTRAQAATMLMQFCTALGVTTGAAA